MANVPISNLTTTWNNVATTFTGIKLNVTDTASAAGSLLADFQVGGVSRFRVSKIGAITFGTTGNYSFLDGVGSNPGEEMLIGSVVRAVILKNGFCATSTYAAIQHTNVFSWSTDPRLSVGDLVLARDAANTLAQRNGVNAQTFRLYNTFTDASNYERGKFEWASNALRIGTEKAGSGAARGLALQTDGVTRLSIASNGTAEFFIAGGIYINGQVGIAPVSAGVMRLVNYNADGFSTLQLGPATTGFPALKVSTSTLQVRLGNDSAFTNIQGKLTTEANAVTEMLVATHSLTLYDAAGTAYKVLAVPA